MLSVVFVVVVVVIVAAAWAYKTANRLDRLNVRVDLARRSLEAALERRSVVARAIATWMETSTDERDRQVATQLTAVADRAERATPDQREDAENDVSAALARTDNGTRPASLSIELADAETRVMMARRFYNDAVRDTRALATRRPVRWLRLGGTAAPPAYFEISERVTADESA
ncbi:NUDIX hydrolase [Gordonia otitidis]|uniref:NUDIX hydrolase n=1 Tax=Gordonia otitidis TaxID=249058 RepID=UPI0005866A10|nr:NUDIX hydrolase [Gordonia otitidis]UEA61742.1 LemA family protein [Gordonia otitidis]